LNTAKEKKISKWEKAMGRRVKFLLLKAQKKTIKKYYRAMSDRAIHCD